MKIRRWFARCPCSHLEEKVTFDYSKLKALIYSRAVVPMFDPQVKLAQFVSAKLRRKAVGTVASIFTLRTRRSSQKAKKPLKEGLLLYLERETRFELATSTLARLRSTN